MNNMQTTTTRGPDQARNIAKETDAQLERRLDAPGNTPGASFMRPANPKRHGLKAR